MTIMDEGNRETSEEIENKFYEEGKSKFEDDIEMTKILKEAYASSLEKAEELFKQFNDAFEERDGNGNKIDFARRQLKMQEALRDFNALFFALPVRFDDWLNQFSSKALD